MRYEELLSLTSGCGFFNTMILLFAVVNGIRMNTSVNILIFAGAPPALNCSSRANVSPGWCITSDGACSAWEYANADASSVVQEWNLCDAQTVVLTIQTVAILGFGSGGYIVAMLSDRFGRIRVYFISAILDIVIIVVRSFSVNVWMYMTLTFSSQFVLGGLVIPTFTYVNEIIHPSKRKTVEFVLFVSSALSQGLLALLAYLVTSWRNVERAQLIFPAAALLITIFTLRESPLWLLVNNQHTAAKDSFLWMMSSSKRADLMEIDFSEISISRENRKTKFKDFASSKQLFFNSLSSVFMMGMTVMVYYIITWNSASFLSGSIFINTFIMGLTEIPNCLLFLVLARFASKKWMIHVSLLVCASCLATGACFKHFIPDKYILYTVFIFLSRMIAHYAHCVLYSFTTEIFPTSLRSSGLGIANLGSRLLSAPMPFVLVTSNEVLLPSLLMSMGVALAALSIIPLPNTFGCRLTDTLEEARDFKRGTEYLFMVNKPQISKKKNDLETASQ